jgi:CRP-like cAMP-binding protein/Fe-S-cluster-containing hydrogenase component 2/thioredoxin reductase
MSEHCEIAIIGAGPAGLSAAVRAAGSGVSHVLLEAAPWIADTLRGYQKAKHVMAEPSALPLRSGLSFGAGPRERILQTWEQELDQSRVRRRLDARVTAIEGSRGRFRLSLEGGGSLAANHVVLAIGLQGNVRRLGVPGEELSRVCYRLEDADEFRDEIIVVVGAGDAGIEDALALMKRNRVILVNRGECVANCTPGNLDAVMAAIADGGIECRHQTTIERIEEGATEAYPLQLIAQGRQGAEKIHCHRVIARLGADPPRRLLEGFGIAFPNADRDALPMLGADGESSVPGLYVAGALAGYPLIKPAMNQGQDVVDRILGRSVEPVDEPALKAKLALFRVEGSVDTRLAEIQRTMGLFAGVSRAQLREMLLASEILTPPAGETVFRHNDYSTSFYSIVAGDVRARVPDWDAEIVLRAGEFFGEMGLISGRRRSATVTAGECCVLIETPRHAMLKLLSIESVHRRVDQVAIRRAIHRYVGLFLENAELDYLARRARVKRCAAGELLFREGDAADGLYLIRRGSVTVSRQIGGREIVLSYVAAGSYVGEMALVSGKPRYATVRAVGGTEVIVLDAELMTWLRARHPNMRRRMNERYYDFIEAGEEEHRQAALPDAHGAHPDNLAAFLTHQGIGEATDVLLIDLSLCIRCGNCEAACADTHQGASRLDREAGSALGALHVPASCRHCEHPHCMKDCPPDAIRRSPGGEVLIMDSCIGCGNCKEHCPYGVIQIATIDSGHRSRSWWRSLFGAAEARRDRAGLPARAVKCDMCKGVAGGPACTRACPTGAALRIGPTEFLAYARQRSGDAARPLSGA